MTATAQQVRISLQKVFFVFSYVGFWFEELVFSLMVKTNHFAVNRVLTEALRQTFFIAKTHLSENFYNCVRQTSGACLPKLLRCVSSKNNSDEFRKETINCERG